MPALRLAVIEGKWWSDSNTSVRGFFDLLSDILLDHPHGYYYEMFTNESAFTDIIKRLGGNSGIDHIYVAAHGDETGIEGSNGEMIDISTIRNILISATRHNDSTIKGMFFGSCCFVNKSGVEELFHYQGNQLKWIAGYSESVSWLASSVLDLFFWNDYMTMGGWRKGISEDVHLVRGGAEARIRDTSRRIINAIPGLARELGLKIYIRENNKPVNLLEELS